MSPRRGRGRRPPSGVLKGASVRREKARLELRQPPFGGQISRPSPGRTRAVTSGRLSPRMHRDQIAGIPQ
jgi:hypothetical protein